MPNHEKPCSDLQVLKKGCEGDFSRLYSKIGGIEQGNKLFWEDIFPRMERKVDECVKFVQQIEMNSKRLNDNATNSASSAEKAEKSAEEAKNAMRKLWIPIGVMVLSCIGMILGVVWKMDEINQRYLQEYKSVKLLDVKTQNINQDRLEEKLDELIIGLQKAGQ